MWYVVIMSVLFVACVAFLVSAVHTENPLFFIGFIVTFIPPLCMVLADSTNTTPQDERSMYLKASFEADVLRSDSRVPFGVASEYMDDIEDMNTLIAKSERWSKNWFMSRIYHSETASLEPIEVGKINAVLVSDTLLAQKQTEDD